MLYQKGGLYSQSIPERRHQFFRIIFELIQEIEWHVQIFSSCCCYGMNGSILQHVVKVYFQNRYRFFWEIDANLDIHFGWRSDKGEDIILLSLIFSNFVAWAQSKTDWNWGRNPSSHSYCSWVFFSLESSSRTSWNMFLLLHAKLGQIIHICLLNALPLSGGFAVHTQQDTQVNQP